MFSRALLTTLNCLDFLLLKGQSQDKISLCKIHSESGKKYQLCRRTYKRWTLFFDKNLAGYKVG
jgi:hypothetical protein